MNNVYFLRLNLKDRELWEIVDEHIFNNRDKVLLNLDNRYSGDYIIKLPDNKITVNLKTFKKFNMDQITCLVTETNLPNYCTCPEFVKIKGRKRKINIYENTSYVSPFSVRSSLQPLET